VSTVFEALAHRLHSQLTELRQSDRLRRELFTNISHDLRTPLTAMRGYIDTIALHADDLSPQQRTECVAIASRHCDRLNRLVEQIFSLARLDVGAMQLQREPVSLAELAQDIVGKYQWSAQSAALVLRLVLDPQSPRVSGDIAMLETVLENLLDNALRHSPAGGEIVVAVRGYEGAVQVQVRDEGSGIEAGDLRRLTRRFEAGHGGRTGLGLAIVSRVLELHGGSLELDSRPGHDGGVPIAGAVARNGG
jgi:signal transduction histidine kinase